MTNRKNDRVRKGGSRKIPGESISRKIRRRRLLFAQQLRKRPIYPAGLAFGQGFPPPRTGPPPFYPAGPASGQCFPPPRTGPPPLPLILPDLLPDSVPVLPDCGLKEHFVFCMNYGRRFPIPYPGTPSACRPFSHSAPGGGSAGCDCLDGMGRALLAPCRVFALHAGHGGRPFCLVYGRFHGGASGRRPYRGRTGRPARADGVVCAYRGHTGFRGVGVADLAGAWRANPKEAVLQA